MNMMGLVSMLDTVSTVDMVDLVSILDIVSMVDMISMLEMGGMADMVDLKWQEASWPVAWARPSSDSALAPAHPFTSQTIEEVVEEVVQPSHQVVEREVVCRNSSM